MTAAADGKCLQPPGRVSGAIRPPRAGRARRLGRLAALTLWAALAAGAQADAGGLAALEDLVRQWTELRRQASDEARDWREQEERLRDEIGWLRLERDAWAEERGRILETGKDEAGRLEARRQHDARLRAASDRLDAVLMEVEGRLRAWTPRIPPSLSGDWEEGVRRVPPPGSAAAGSLARRAQGVAALLALLEEWQAGVHRVREILALGNGREPREFEVLYLGLARGFALSADGAIAAVGEPHPDGWRWTERPDQAGRIADALDAFGTRDARLVFLPIRLRDVEP